MELVFAIGDEVEYHGRPKRHAGQLVRTVRRAFVTGFLCEGDPEANAIIDDVTVDVAHLVSTGHPSTSGFVYQTNSDGEVVFRGYRLGDIHGDTLKDCTRADNVQTINPVCLTGVPA